MRLPVLGRLGQRVSWMLVTGVLVIAAVVNLALVDPAASIDSVVDRGDPGRHRRRELRHRHRRLSDRDPRAAPARRRLGHVAIWLAHRLGRRGRARAGRRGARGWEAAYLACAAFALPAMLTALFYGRAQAAPRRRPRGRASRAAVVAVWQPFVEFFQRKGALLVLLFILLHKIGDTLANLTFRLLFDDLGFTQRRDRALRRRRRLLGLSDRHLHRRHPLRAARA